MRSSAGQMERDEAGFAATLGPEGEARESGSRACRPLRPIASLSRARSFPPASIELSISVLVPTPATDATSTSRRWRACSRCPRRPMIRRGRCSTPSPSAAIRARSENSPSRSAATSCTAAWRGCPRASTVREYPRRWLPRCHRRHRQALFGSVLRASLRRPIFPFLAGSVCLSGQVMTRVRPRS